jgi:hypothetical protein
MKRHLDSIAASLGLVLGVAAMAGALASGEFAKAAAAEARGYQALFHLAAGDGCRSATVPATLLAANGVAQ